MERKLLQIAFAFAGLVLVGFGFAGVFFGADFLDLSGNVVMDSYIRFPLARASQRGALT